MILNAKGVGDILICLRILNGKCAYLRLKIIGRSNNEFYVESIDTFDRYKFTRNTDKEVYGLSIILTTPGSTKVDDNIKEYLFEDVNSCKEFAINYLNNTIQSCKSEINKINTSWK